MTAKNIPVPPATPQMWLLAVFLSLPIALLPIARSFMLPLGMLAILGLFMLVGLLRHRQQFNTEDKALQVLPRVFLFIWLPMLVSWPDAEVPEQVQKVASLYPLYALMALAVVILLRATAASRQLAILGSWIVGVWAFDGVAQTLLGIDMFNIPLDREGVVAGHASGFFTNPNKYGFYMGMFAAMPLFTMYLCGVNRLTHILVSTLVTAGVLVGAARGGWIMYAWALIPYLYLVYIKPAKRPIIPMLVLPLLLVAMFAITLQFSAGVQERVKRSMAASQELTYESLNTASSGRVDIYLAAWNMVKANPVNGIGVDSYEQRFRAYLPEQANIPDSVTVPHAHQVILEVWSGAGTLGLFGFLLAWAAMWRLWKQALPEQRKLALPFIIPLAVLWWPINTHRGFYPSELAVLTLFMLALSIAALTQARVQTK
ncbi:O-antigen ligase family protein [Agitococcus lubricus]|uniref:O-antigen ligase n=1 Tax=Agitococcus lubricus TaxID=1077255 RepID=A0A2T5J0V8_9GAMM|nr:O-antigen ligase family protein [Agitococcus lubricus]PTQ90028.1 O-antigen ligase [Agitococcus lubricus]